MIPNDNVLMFFKFSEKRWIDKIVEGNISFSCTGSFITQARIYKNNIQGDLCEGVFARLKKNDDRIQLMKEQLKYDLEIINDGDYVMLRRHSSKLIPIFCLYGVTGKDLLIENEDILKNNPEGLNKLKHYFDNNMYVGFSDYNIRNVINSTHRLVTLHIQPANFLDNIKCSLFREKIEFKINKINYDYFKNDTFFIQPTKDYNELFYKFPQYDKQYEVRCCLYNKKLHSIFNRFNLKISPLIRNDDYFLSYDKLYITIDAVTKKYKNIVNNY